VTVHSPPPERGKMKERGGRGGRGGRRGRRGAESEIFEPPLWSFCRVNTVSCETHEV